MPTADATLLPPPYISAAASGASERGSVRRLDEVGVEAVLEAMIEQKQRRASQPSYPAVSEISELAEPVAGADEGSEQAPAKSEVFLKTR